MDAKNAEKLTKLLQLQINEVSGVDFPASMLDGWVVQKARKPVQDALKSASVAPEAVIIQKTIERILEKAVYNDSLAEMEQTDFACLNDVELRTIQAVLPDVLTKAKHDLKDSATGRFVPLRGEIHGVPAGAASKSAIHWTHLGKPLPALAS